MATITHEITLEVGSSSLPFYKYMKEGDGGSIYFRITLMANGVQFTPASGDTAYIRVLKADGNSCMNEATINNDGTITACITQQMTAAPGTAKADIVITAQDESSISTATFFLDVDIAPLGESIESTSEVLFLASLVSRGEYILGEYDSAIGEITEAKNSAIAAAAVELTEMVEAAEDDIEDAADDALRDIGDAADTATGSINQKAAQVQQIATDADSVAAQALTKAGNAENATAEFAALVETVQMQIQELTRKMADRINDGYVENGIGYFTSDGEIIFQMTGMGGGGGGGGGSSGNNAVLTVTNNSGWISSTVATGGSCTATLNWSSIEDELPTGNGTLKVTVNGIVKLTQEVAQGDVSVNLASYCGTGSNVCRVQISDVYGNARTINFTVTVVELTISSTFDAGAIYTGPFSFPYTPVGAVAKTVYFYLDGSLLGTQQTSVSGRQMTYAIPAQNHGAHTLRVYFEATVNSETVRSNELYFEFIAVNALDNTVIIASDFRQTTATQYETLSIPYRVYTPDSLTSAVSLYAGSVKIADLTVDRTTQTWNYRADDYGSLTLYIMSGNVIKQFTLTVSESEIDVQAETDSLALFLTSAGRSNNELNPGTWEDEDNDISCVMTGFNFVSDGWINDSDGYTALRVSGDARVTIPYQPFASDFRTTGKTIEIEFATRNILNYDAPIISCMSGGRGFQLTAQKAALYSEQSEIYTQYKEDEHVRIAFVAEKRSENRLLAIYINGVMSGVVQYAEDDDFSQAVPVNISIGSNSCMTDIYNIRVYDNDLNRFQIVDNWIADTQDIDDMIDRYTRNNIFDAYGNIVIRNLPGNLPYLILEAAELPQYKGDKKTVTGTFVAPDDTSRSFTFTGAQADVQGTSSQYYPRKNYKIKFKGGFTMTATGAAASTFRMRNNSIPTDTFTFKTDFASSEGTNNVELVRLYNGACPYQTPAQEEDSRIRQGIDGFPIVVFWHDTTTDTTTFIGKYNFNNDSGTAEVYGFEDGDESWEIRDNTSARALWKSADFSGTAWKADFKPRYPDTDPEYEDTAQLAEFAAWAVSTDTTAATGNALPQSVTYDGTTYTNDTAAYRLAKFKAEAGDYMEMQSALFYYLFTEAFLMVDSRAKNAFPSFIGEEISNE